MNQTASVKVLGGCVAVDLGGAEVAAGSVEPHRPARVATAGAAGGAGLAGTPVHAVAVVAGTVGGGGRRRRGLVHPEPQIRRHRGHCGRAPEVRGRGCGVLQVEGGVGERGAGRRRRHQRYHHRDGCRHPRPHESAGWIGWGGRVGYWRRGVLGDHGLHIVRRGRQIVRRGLIVRGGLIVRRARRGGLVRVGESELAGLGSDGGQTDQREAAESQWDPVAFANPDCGQTDPGHPQGADSVDGAQGDGGGVVAGVGVTAGDQQPVVVDADEPMKPEPVGMVGVVEQQHAAQGGCAAVERTGDGDVTDVQPGQHRAAADGCREPSDHRRDCTPQPQTDHGRQHALGQLTGRQPTPGPRPHLLLLHQVFCASQVRPNAAVPPWAESGTAELTV